MYVSTLLSSPFSPERAATHCEHKWVHVVQLGANNHHRNEHEGAAGAVLSLTQTRLSLLQRFTFTIYFLPPVWMQTKKLFFFLIKNTSSRKIFFFLFLY